MPPKERDPRAGGQITPLSKRDKHNAKRKTRGTGDGEWRVVKGVRKFFKS